MEIALRGIGVSPGIGIGPALAFDVRPLDITRRQVEDYYILQEQLNELLELGYAVKVVELYSKDERQDVRLMIEDREKEYEATQRAIAAQSSASTPSSEASDGTGSAEILDSTVPLYENEKFAEDNANKAA